MRVPKDLRPIVKSFERQGGSVEMGGKSHFKFRDASGRLVATHPHSSAHQSGLRALRGELRRAGVEV